MCRTYRMYIPGFKFKHVEKSSENFPLAGSSGEIPHLSVFGHQRSEGFVCIFVYENRDILIPISRNFVPKRDFWQVIVGSCNIWHRIVDKPSHITVTSWWAWWRLKSPASPLFSEPFIQAQTKENIKAQRNWPLCGEFTGDRWIPRTNGQ